MHKYLLVPCLLFLAILSACESDTAVTTTPMATAKPIPTQKPVNNAMRATTGPTLLGLPLSNFVGEYKQPNDHTDTKEGMYHFQRWAGSNIDYLIIGTDLIDKGYSNTVESISVQSSDNPATPAITTASCASFMPNDAIYKRQMTITTGTGYDKIYSSASLARLFPADAFDDSNNVQTTTGSFDVQYLIRPDGSIDSCTLQIGTQQAQ